MCFLFSFVWDGCRSSWFGWSFLDGAMCCAPQTQWLICLDTLHKGVLGVAADVEINIQRRWIRKSSTCNSKASFSPPDNRQRTRTRRGIIIAWALAAAAAASGASVARSIRLADMAWTAKQRSDFVQNFWAMELEGSGWNIHIYILGWLIVNSFGLDWTGFGMDWTAKGIA